MRHLGSVVDRVTISGLENLGERVFRPFEGVAGKREQRLHLPHHVHPGAQAPTVARLPTFGRKRYLDGEQRGNLEDAGKRIVPRVGPIRDARQPGNPS